jgi:hypothetical protein
MQASSEMWTEKLSSYFILLRIYLISEKKALERY